MREFIVGCVHSRGTQTPGVSPSLWVRTGPLRVVLCSGGGLLVCPSLSLRRWSLGTVDVDRSPLPTSPCDPVPRGGCPVTPPSSLLSFWLGYPWVPFRGPPSLSDACPRTGDPVSCRHHTLVGSLSQVFTGAVVRQSGACRSRGLARRGLVWSRQISSGHCRERWSRLTGPPELRQ